MSSFLNTTTKNSSRPVFWGGLRTVFGTAHRGGLKETRPDDLLVQLLDSHKSKFPEVYSSPIDDIVTGCAYPEGEQGYNVARMVALASGLEASGTTINRLCGSSLEALSMSSAQIIAGRGENYIVTGVESMSRVPRRGANFSESNIVRNRASDAYINMGETAERVANQYPNLSRGTQEEFAARSHELAHNAWDAGKYNSHVIAINGIKKDEAVRYPANLEKMGSLPPAFSSDGVVTAATSSPMSDGATCGFVTSIEFAKNMGATLGLEILDIQNAHVPPDIMGLGPIPAVKKILKRNGIKITEISAVEMNEAFAIQSLACMNDLGIHPGILNSWGGALALGHPLGASGLRLMMTLAGRMGERGDVNALGLATLCVGGGQGVAVLTRLIEL